jgi:CheY-like chemotaxis protein
MIYEYGMTPWACASPVEGLRMVQTGRNNLVVGLIDICMPGCMGTELAKQIKYYKPVFPLIALTRSNNFVNTEHFEYKLEKPVNKIALKNAIYRTILQVQSDASFIGNEYYEPLPINIPMEAFDKTRKILVVEDVFYNRNLLVKMLGNLGYTNIDTAENGSEAIEMIKDSQKQLDNYEIMLLDLRMPVLDGYEVIKIHSARGWKLPHIVVITASIMDSDKSRCEKMGVNYFLNKPLEMKKLKNVMLQVSKQLHI